MNNAVAEFAEGVEAPPPDREEFLRTRARGFSNGSRKGFYDYLKKPVRTVPPAPEWMMKPLKPLGRKA